MAVTPHPDQQLDVPSVIRTLSRLVVVLAVVRCAMLFGSTSRYTVALSLLVGAAIAYSWNLYRRAELGRLGMAISVLCVVGWLAVVGSPWYPAATAASRTERVEGRLVGSVAGEIPGRRGQPEDRAPAAALGLVGAAGVCLWTSTSTRRTSTDG